MQNSPSSLKQSYCELGAVLHEKSWNLPLEDVLSANLYMTEFNLYTVQITPIFLYFRAVFLSFVCSV